MQAQRKLLCANGCPLGKVVGGVVDKLINYDTAVRVTVVPWVCMSLQPLVGLASPIAWMIAVSRPSTVRVVLCQLDPCERWYSGIRT